MPIYEYDCLDCGERYEKLIRTMKAKVIVNCPICGSQHARKAISLFGSRSTQSNSNVGQVSDTSGCTPVG